MIDYKNHIKIYQNWLVVHAYSIKKSDIPKISI
jgi:hypothetical protein